MSSSFRCDIITGALLPNYPSNYNSVRFKYTDCFKNRVNTYNHHQKKAINLNNQNHSLKNPKRLSESHKRQLKYATNLVLPTYPQLMSPKITSPNNKQSHTESLLNHSNVSFNIINHSKTSHTQSSLPYNYQQNIGYSNQSIKNYSKINQIIKEQFPRITYKRSNVSKYVDLGRLNAPNYSKDYRQKLKKNPNSFKRKLQICNKVCEMEKSYGVQKYFRKYK